MYSPDDFVPISALQHYAFCPRQCAIIHIEMEWEDNLLTAEGKIMHSRVHSRDDETRGDIHIARGLDLVSSRLGVVGKSDVVEFHRSAEGIKIPGRRGLWVPFPVEYKRGRPKKDLSDKVQLCAQAMCLEEMLGIEVREGALFYGATRRRLDVVFDDFLREQTELVAKKVHNLLNSGEIPPPQYSKRCRNCSVIELCMPQVISPGRVRDYLAEIFGGEE